MARHCQAAVAGWQVGRARFGLSRRGVSVGQKEGADTEAELSADVSDPCRVSAPKPPNWVSVSRPCPAGQQTVIGMLSHIIC